MELSQRGAAPPELSSESQFGRGTSPMVSFISLAPPNDHDIMPPIKTSLLAGLRPADALSGAVKMAGGALVDK